MRCSSIEGNRGRLNFNNWRRSWVGSWWRPMPSPRRMTTMFSSRQGRNKKWHLNPSHIRSLRHRNKSQSFVAKGKPNSEQSKQHRDTAFPGRSRCPSYVSFSSSWMPVGGQNDSRRPARRHANQQYHDTSGSGRFGCPPRVFFLGPWDPLGCQYAPRQALRSPPKQAAS